jgi:hypothetical protein
VICRANAAKLHHPTVSEGGGHSLMEIAFRLLILTPEDQRKENVSNTGHPKPPFHHLLSVGEQKA